MDEEVMNAIEFLGSQGFVVMDQEEAADVVRAFEDNDRDFIEEFIGSLRPPKFMSVEDCQEAYDEAMNGKD